MGRDFPRNFLQYRIWQKEGDEEESMKPELRKEAPKQEVTQEKKRLSYKEKREFDQLQQDIASLEKEKVTITEQMNNGSLPFDQLQQLSVRINEITNLLDEKEL